MTETITADDVRKRPRKFTVSIECDGRQAIGECYTHRLKDGKSMCRIRFEVAGDTDYIYRTWEVVAAAISEGKPIYA